MGYKDIYKLQSIAGANAKCEFIKAHRDDIYFKRFLYFALNPMLTYNISKKSTDKLMAEENFDGQKLIFFNDIFECCEHLSRLRGMDDATLRQVKMLLNVKYPEMDERELYIQLLSKKVRLGIAAKTINKIIPNLIPEWEVQQAYTVEKYPLKEGTEFWLTQKLNGARATLYEGQLLARSGMPYKGLEHITDALSWLRVAGFVADGELTLKDKGDLSDNEAFRVSTGILNSDNVNKTVICYTIFDMIPVKDFDALKPQVTYRYRRDILNQFAERIADTDGAVKVLPVLYHGTDQSKIEELLEQMVREDKEGLMINTDAPYRRTRHKGILKVKRFYTMDLPIIRCEEGTGRLSGTLGAFVLKYKENEVKVGSGFTDEQREQFWNNRDDMEGLLCEVKYKEISQDKGTGLESLQFPVFVGIRTDKTEVSYS
jgi:DNA ligase-1|nr:MAG TPA: THERMOSTABLE DNA LIGASE [Caudoviricetes sp.]